MKQMARISALVVALLVASIIGAGGGLTAFAASGPRASSTPRVYITTYRTPDSPAHCAALQKAFPQRANNPQGYNTVVIQKVIVKQAAPTASSPYIYPGGCQPYNPKAAIEIDQTMYGSLQLYELEQDTEFIGDGCSTPGFGEHHCYPVYTVWGVTATKSWCDTSTDTNWTAWGHAGFWVSGPSLGLTAKIDTAMPYWMNNWYSNCSPVNCN